METCHEMLTFSIFYWSQILRHLIPRIRFFFLLENYYTIFYYIIFYDEVTSKYCLKFSKAYMFFSKVSDLLSKDTNEMIWKIQIIDLIPWYGLYSIISAWASAKVAHIKKKEDFTNQCLLLNKGTAEIKKKNKTIKIKRK